MSLRKIESVTNNETGKSATVYRDSEWNEYVVRFYVNGKHQTEADYHTDSKPDAQMTARTVWNKG